MEMLLDYERLDGKIGRVMLNWESCVAMGYTGRDRGKVEAHIKELQAMGVPSPAVVPSMYWVSPRLVSVTDKIYVVGEKTSGEVEFFLAFSESGELYFTVASDHTDRELEKISVAKAKQICEKVIASKCWKVSDVYEHWDEIEISLHVKPYMASEFVLYQRGKLKDMLVPEDLLEMAKKDRPCDGNVSVLSGTIPLLTKNVVFAEVYKMSMFDPVLNRRIEHAYRVVKLLDRS